MKPSTHLLVSFILALVFYPMFGWKAVFILAGGILIDLDHYLWCIFRHKNLSLLDCYKYFIDGFDKERVKKNIGILLVFHTIEFLLIVGIISFFSQTALLFAVGILSHYLLDLIWLYSVPKQLIANHSIILWLIQNTSKKFK